MSAVYSGLSYSKLLILLFVLSKCDSKRVVYSIVDGTVLKVFEVPSINKVPDTYLSKATYDNKINTTGWAFLEIHTSKDYEDEKQAYSAGFLEGVLTHDLIWMYWQNTMKDICDGRKFACFKIKRFLDKNDNWLESMINSEASKDPYWYQVKLYLKQIQGLADGYNKIVNDPNKALSRELMLAINLQGDLEDLFAMEGVGNIRGSGHCSALIKILPDGSNIFTSQVTWNSYQSMLRIQKKYVTKFKLYPGSSEIIKGHTMSFSSYPGQLQSGDDFYIISSGLITLETTIGNSNKDLWPNVSPYGQVMEFVRTMVANRLATSGENWVAIFKKYNSGTYNNQWMIVDHGKFKPNPNGTPIIKDGLLWVLEQLPGITEAKDMTNFIKETSYWPSYNLPYFPNIYNMSGTREEARKFGDWFTYDKHPRALIFKRDHSKVKNMDDMYALMRYNDFKHDPLSRCECNPPYSAENAIAARNDLNLVNGTYPFRALGHRSHGATDAKITNLKLASTYQFLSVSGPPHDVSKGIPPFKWSEVDFGKTTPHIGHPDEWQFKPITYNWDWN